MSELQSWRDRFNESLSRLVGTQAGPSHLIHPSIDEYLNEFPLEPDQRWGSEMDELHRVALRAAVLRQIAFVSNDLEMGLAMCESPPERAMLYALAIVAWESVDGVLIKHRWGASGLASRKFSFVEIEPQASVGRYRVDFLLTMRINKPLASAQLVVECDGHEWHERTKQQASRDRARDRELQSEDLAVFRYTGSDLWRDVFAAAWNAMEELDRRFDATFRSARRLDETDHASDPAE